MFDERVLRVGAARRADELFVGAARVDERADDRFEDLEAGRAEDFDERDEGRAEDFDGLRAGWEDFDLLAELDDFFFGASASTNESKTTESAFACVRCTAPA